MEIEYPCPDCGHQQYHEDERVVPGTDQLEKTLRCNNCNQLIWGSVERIKNENV